MWFWRRLEKTTWTDCVRNEEELIRVKEKRNIILYRIKRRNAKLDCFNLRICLLKRVIERRLDGEKEEVMYY